MDAVKIWGKTLRAAMRLNVVKVSRAEFLEKELGHYCAPATIEKIISGEKKTYNLIPIETLDHVAAGCINYQTTVACSIAAVAGVPGGLGLALAIPADLAQFYGNILALSQKLMYIYGWPDIRDKKGEIDDATLQVLTLFVGVAMGCKEAGKAINAILAKLSDQLIRNIPRKTRHPQRILLRRTASRIMDRHKNIKGKPRQRHRQSSSPNRRTHQRRHDLLHIQAHGQPPQEAPPLPSINEYWITWSKTLLKTPSFSHNP